VLIVLSGAVATGVLFTVDAFFAFAGWRFLFAKQTWGRRCVQRLHAYTEKHEPVLAVVAMATAGLLAFHAGHEQPRVACLASGGLVALVAHLLLYARTACLVRGFDNAEVGSAEWQRCAGRLETAMVTRASLQAAAFICIVAAGLVS